jgi:acyl transferase domain-containing protein/surfactin synthase thioesterase subunit/NAD(P)-dependent dehydrogenase (short-subunit alcohol dehydrogenase family)/acyl carrier protein
MQPRHPDQLREPIAVVGIGCRFPGGLNSPAAYWDALLAGLDAIREVPLDRWKHSRFHDTDPDKSGCIRNAKGGFIDGVDLFDADFFGYFPTEAQRLDPQQRLLLEVTHEAMEDAGIRRDQLDGSNTSVFIGSFMYDYLCMQTASEQRDQINPYVAMGTGITSLANRISYDFNLKGPSVSLDTACSSSLVAVHLACRSLWNREAEMAIAGGVNVMLRPESSIMLSKAGFLSPDQYCKAFDASANGYVRGEGVGVVILKPLSKALADDDAIYALVRGTGVNQDGYMPEGFTVPNVFSQLALLRSVYAEAGIDPTKVDFVEAHGTGTAVGDPIESFALGAVLGRDRSDGRRCLIGSVKTNLGHLEGAAGIAGFIKAVLTAHHGIVAPNLHFHEPNPGIPFEDLKLEVPTRPTPLEREGHPLTIGVNSFGAGGTNAHAVLQEPASAFGNRQSAFGRKPIAGSRWPVADGRGKSEVGETLYMLSAAQRDSLRDLALRHADFLSAGKQRLDDLAFSAFTRRSHYPQVLAVVGESSKEIADKLRRFADGQVDRETLAAQIPRQKKPKLAFVFSGQGGQWARMGLRLRQREAVFRHALEEIDALFHDLAGWSILEELKREEGNSKIDDTVVVQPAVMAIQIALLKLYEHYGIRPRGVMGHSLGEVAAAFAAGALTLEDAVRVIYHRSQAQNLAEGKGGMLAVGLALPEARKLIEGYDDRVSIGAVNGPTMLTLSGDSEPLQQIAELLEARGVFNRPVRVQVAYHSYHMESIQERLLESLDEVSSRVATTPLYSTVTGHREIGTHLKPEYWYRNARQPVLFTDALATMVKDGFNTFIEIGPHPVLVGGAEALFQTLDNDAVIGPAMTRREPEVVIFLQSLARLAAAGCEPDTTVLFGSERRFVRLPKYPWQHKRYWFEAPAAGDMRRGRFEHPFLKRQTQLITEEGFAVWDASLDVQRFPFLRDHQVDGEIVFPATGHLELAWAVAGEQFRQEGFFLENLHFVSPLILPDAGPYPPDVRLEISSGEGDYHICSRPAAAPADAPWSKHSSGRINTMHDRFEKATVPLAELRSRFGTGDEVPVKAFYQTICSTGLDYGEKFRCLQQLWHRGHDNLAYLQLADDLLAEAQRYAIHPVLFDACLHVVFADVHGHGDPDSVYLPYSIDRVKLYRRPSRNVWSHVHVTQNDERILKSDTLIFDEEGELVAEVLGLVCKRLSGTRSRPADLMIEGCYEYRWTPTPRSADRSFRLADFTRAVVIANSSEVAAELAQRLTAEGIDPLLVPFPLSDSFDHLLADVPMDRRTLIVLAPGLSMGAVGGQAPFSASASCLQAPKKVPDPFPPPWKGLANSPWIPAFLQLAQTLHKREGVPRLFLVTNGAAGVTGDRNLDLGQATLHGMARVVRNEGPNIPLTVIDLSEASAPVEIEGLFEELLHARLDQDESEIALRGSARLVRQLQPVDREAAEQAAAREEKGVGGAYRAEQSDPGIMEQIVFRRSEPRTPGEEEVEIAVRAAALNFKDIMNAMGLLPENAVRGGLACARLGLEVCGQVLRTGPRVQHVKPGDEVIARVADGFSGRVLAPAHCVVLKPENLTPQQAAAIPVVFITAWYSLCHLARIERGETVLIHSAAGGVGTAAIQLAHRAGATVIATAGTKEKRAYVQNLGVRHVFDSRSLDFYNQVMEVTGGRGVDIVLNSLTGRFILQSLKCLAPFGRFVELGKADIYRNGKLNLQRLGENISYFVIDVDRLAVQKPALHQQILNDVVALCERGELKPPDITEFPISKLADAMKFMTRAAYQGKIVLNMQEDSVRTLPPRMATFRPDRCYLLSGGASGFGLEIARWLVSRGARHLVLLSRSGPKSEADREMVTSLMDQGVRVLLAQTDVTDRNALGRLLKRIQNEMPPLAGVIHGAAVLDDATVPSMTMGRFERVFNPKAQGAWNLHAATLAAGADLDFFLMLSSISSVLGLYGQVNYAAANFFQDALAHYRRQLGLPATSVNLGVLGQYAGMSRTANEDPQETAVEAKAVIGLLESQGMAVMPLPEVLAKLEAVLLQQPIGRMAARFDWSRFRIAYPHLVRDSRFVELMSDAALARGSRQKSAGLRAVLAEMPKEKRPERLQQELSASLARSLDVPAEKIDVAASLDTLGLDSLMLTQMRNWALRALDINLPLIKLLKGPSIASLAADLLVQVDEGNGAEVKESAQDSTSFTLANLEGLHVLGPWLIRGTGNSKAPFRLICFHSMGVGASLFTKFLLKPPDDYDILAVQTPGRENRLAEPVVESVDQLADQIVPQLLPLLDRPVVFWGHSFGGIVAWEVVNRLRQRYQREPAHFVVSGTMPPCLIQVWQKRETMLKPMVADNSPEYLISLARYVDDQEFIKSILPPMRRDYPLLKSYRFQPFHPLNCPITVFAARLDDMVYTDELRQWSRHTDGGFDLIEFDGDHWFLNRNHEQINAAFHEIAATITAGSGLSEQDENLLPPSAAIELPAR